MTHNVEIKDGDMGTLIEVVNNNTIKLDDRLYMVEEGLESLTRRFTRFAKNSSKSIKCICFAGILICVSVHYIRKDVDSINKRLKKLEDEKIYNDYMRDEAENDCLE